jgi:carboxylesterase type B
LDALVICHEALHTITPDRSLCNHGVCYIGNNRKAYKYAVSTLPAIHGLDQIAYFNEPRDISHGEAFSEELGKIWGNFVVSGDPRVEGLEDWPVWDSENAAMANCELFPR